ncbi:flagellar hook-length control protein FliK [Nocardioides sp. CPCC 206347]|uniref:flagellar hook-length control protein FliK n=1 Tax=Nocardioides sp. CPCC 206347 TaxID=3406463 RepID=UPI003B428CF6
MSIAPFLPGLLAPAPVEVGTTTGTPSGQPGDAQPGAEGEVAFMDALAAALAVQAPATPVAVAPAAPAAPAAPVADASAPPEPVVPATPIAELGFVTPELGFVTPELGFVTAELGFVTPELGFVTAELGFVTPDLGFVTPGPDVPTPSPTHPLPGHAAYPGPSTGTSATNVPHAPEQAAPEVPVRTTAPVDVPADLPKAPVAPLELSTLTPDSTATNTDSMVTNPNSGVTNPNSAVTNPKSVERAVVAQVFPEVTRLASSGNGTHRITLTLQPAQLGEVRVTLVVRDGAVRVRMSGEAGDGAVRQALATGAPELQRMLERAGATEARVLVRDVNAAPQLGMPTPAARNDLSQAWSGQPDQQHSSQSSQSGQSGESGHPGQSQRDTHPGRPGHPLEQAGRRAAPADVVPTSTPTPGRLDRNL